MLREWIEPTTRKWIKPTNTEKEIFKLFKNGCVHYSIKNISEGHDWSLRQIRVALDMLEKKKCLSKLNSPEGYHENWYIIHPNFGKWNSTYKQELKND
jgi:hypothetical protein